jgi:hypothetical protein
MAFTNVIGSIFSEGASRLVDSIGNAIDKTFTSDEERLEAKRKIQQILSDLETQVLIASQREQEELTKRLEVDVRSDNWLAKNIRPLTLIFITLAVTTLSFWTIFGSLSPAQQAALTVWVNFWSAVALTVYGFYFGSRGLEKIATAVSSRRADK